MEPVAVEVTSIIMNTIQTIALAYLAGKAYQGPRKY